MNEALARQAGFVVSDGTAKLCHPTPKASGLYGMLDNYEQLIVQKIVARLEAGFGASSSAPLIIKKEFLK